MADNKPEEVDEERSLDELEQDLEEADETFDIEDGEDEVEETEAEDEPEPEAEETETEDEPEPEESNDEPLETESETQEEPEETPEETQEPEETDEQKKLAEEAFKRREAERKLREEREQQEKQRLDSYLKEAGEDETERTKRQLEVDAYLLNKQRIEINERALEADLKRAASSIDLFQKGSPEVKEALLEAVDDFERMYVVKDKNGRPVEIKGDIYEHLTKKADSIRRLTGVGAREKQKNEAKTKARTLNPPNAKPKEKKPDPMVDAFSEEFADIL